MRVSAGNRVNLETTFRRTDNTEVSNLAPTVFTSPGAFLHVALVYERSIGKARVFLSGTMLSEFEVGSVDAQTAYDLYVGFNPQSTNRNFVGVIDELSLYDRPLAPDELAAIAAAGPVGKCLPEGNKPPVVEAGADQIVRDVSDTLTLDGFVADDGRPLGGALDVAWSKRSGPGEVTFGNATAVSTTATFSGPGIYSLDLSANDSLARSTDTVMIRVGLPNGLFAGMGIVGWWPGNSTPEDVVGGNDAELSSVGLLNSHDISQNLLWSRRLNRRRISRR